MGKISNRKVFYKMSKLKEYLKLAKKSPVSQDQTIQKANQFRLKEMNHATLEDVEELITKERKKLTENLDENDTIFIKRITGRILEQLKTLKL